MCLYVDSDDLAVLMKDGERKARKEHHCTECGRRIDPGEIYRFWERVEPGEGWGTEKMCAHCWGTIELGSSLTGCPKVWWWDEVHNHLDEDMGFVANIIHDDGHSLTPAQVFSMLRTTAMRKRQWRWSDGSLMPVPSPAKVAT